MSRWIVGGATLAMLLVSAVRGASAQAADSWPSAGTQLARVEDASVPPTSDIASIACSRRLRDPRTGREYMLRHSRAETSMAQHQSGATTSTTSRVVRARGDYARVGSKGDTLSTRVVAVDCLTTRVVARRAGT